MKGAHLTVPGRALLNKEEHWVFAYGSLLWNPGFDPAESQTARLTGYARSFCMYSVSFRGTEESPGLVLALDEDPRAHCIGLALRADSRDWARILAELRERELTTSGYSEHVLPVDLADGRRVQAITYVVRRQHCHYAAGLSLADQARIIASARGGRGPNFDYLFNTARHLAQLGLDDPALEELAQEVRDLLETKGD